MAAEDFPKSYRDPQYAALDASNEQKLGLPPGMLQAIRTDGERTNADRVSSAGARTPYQVTPSTRKLVISKYGIDPYLSPANASEVAGLLLKESLDRNKGDAESAVREYHGGTNRDNWGKQNEAYWSRVGSALEVKKVDELSSQFAQWNKANPATPTAAPAAPVADPVGQKLSEGFSAWKQGVDLIPDSTIPADRAPVSTSMPAAPEVSAPGIMDTAIGSGEAILNAATGVLGGAVGMAGGGAAGILKSIKEGTIGTQEGVRAAEQSAAAGAQALTYQPRTESGQEQAEAVGKGMQSLIPIAAIAHTLPPMVTAAKGTPAGVMARAGAEGAARDIANVAAKPVEAVGLVAPGAAGEVAAGAVAAGAKAAATGVSKVSSMARTATTLPRRALERLTGADEPTPTPGTRGSAGSMGTDIAAQRRATAAQLPVPVDELLTKGMLSRDPAQLKFEVETAKIPGAGKPLRERVNQINQALLDNFDTAIDQTGAMETSLRAVGAVVDKALVDKAARAKTEIRSRYKAAETAGEMESPVLLQSVVDHLNESAPDAATAPLLTTARARAIQTGLAIEGADGQLVAQPVTLKRAETFRQAVGAATDYTPTNIRQSTIIKGLVDEATDGMGGDLYKQARSARARYAQEFENHAVIAKLLNNKRGTADRQVAMEDIYSHTILKGSLDNVRIVRRVLQTAGEEGKQAWRELQGATLRDITEKAKQSVALDATGNRVMSASALDKAITELDADGKLDFIFGKKGAQTLRDIRELAQIAKTVPPEAAINMSNTASTLLAGFGDIAGYGVSGLPVPIMSLGRAAMGYIKDVKLRNRIQDALNQQRQ